MMDSRHMILEMHDVFENKPSSFADWVVTPYFGTAWVFLEAFLKVILNMVHHHRRTAERPCPNVEGKALLAKAEYALILLADEREGLW
jgi:hypothetical protein